MALLTGMTADGLEVPVQVLPDGKLVAEGLEGRPGTDGDDAVIGGTAALPGLHPLGDVDTGLFSPAADYIGVSTAGILRFSVSAAGQVGIGQSYAPASVNLSLVANLPATPSCYSLFNGAMVNKANTSATLFATSASTEAAVYSVDTLRHYHATQGSIGAGSVLKSQRGFDASHSLAGAQSNYGFYGNLQYSANSWNFYAAGSADSWFASNNFIFANGGAEKARFNNLGQLLIGRDSGLAGSAAKLQCASTVNLSVSTYADNASAKAAGLVAGDVYRKADGTLMIAF